MWLSGILVSEIWQKGKQWNLDLGLESVVSHKQGRFDNDNKWMPNNSGSSDNSDRFQRHPPALTCSFAHILKYSAPQQVACREVPFGRCLLVLCCKIVV